MSDLKEADVQPQSGGIIVSTGLGRYVIAGSGIIVTFTPETQQHSAGIVSIREGHFEDGRWLSGDEDHQGWHVRLPFGGFGIQKVRLYSLSLKKNFLPLQGRKSRFFLLIMTKQAVFWPQNAVFCRYLIFLLIYFYRAEKIGKKA
jgi:hypothetical protein